MKGENPSNPMFNKGDEINLSFSSRRAQGIYDRDFVENCYNDR